MSRSTGGMWQTKSIPGALFQHGKNKKPLTNMDLIHYKNTSTLIGKLPQENLEEGVMYFSNLLCPYLLKTSLFLRSCVP